VGNSSIPNNLSDELLARCDELKSLIFNAINRFRDAPNGSVKAFTNTVGNPISVMSQQWRETMARVITVLISTSVIIAAFAPAAYTYATLI